MLIITQIAWHSGEPLATTLYTSSYIDHLLSISSNVLADKVFQSPESQVDENEYPLVHLVLRSYCLATIKCLNLVYEQVRCEMFYEVGDFASHVTQIASHTSI